MALSFNNLKISNPKRGIEQPQSRLEWHDYYAGYSPNFVFNLLNSVDIDKNELILDPWNGIGTTTLAASALGFKSKGFDLNPVTIIIAKALKIDDTSNTSLVPLSKEIATKALRLTASDSNEEPLEQWFSTQSAQFIRNIEKSVQFHLIENKKSNYSFINFSVEKVSDLAAFYYLALFKMIRAMLSKFLGTNPTWIKSAKNTSEKIDIDKKSINALFLDAVVKMAANLAPVFSAKFYGETHLGIGNSEEIKCNNNEAGLVITSPPYCTRIDYAVYTMPELALLGFSEQRFDTLRRSLIGTTTVPKILPEISLEWGVECNSFLEKLRNHPSRASDTYYLKNHVQYFSSMYQSLSEVDRVLNDRGGAILVVQDSNYKEIHNDLPTIISQMSINLGWKLRHKADFASPFNMSGLNSKSKKYTGKSIAVESVLCFQK